MFSRLTALPLPELKKWCAIVLILLAPGALIIVPIIWLIRYFKKNEACVNEGRPDGFA